MMQIFSEDDLSYNVGIYCLFFCSDWVPGFKKYLNMISKVENKYKEISYVFVNTDKLKSLCQRFNVTSVPTIIIFNNGDEVKRAVGMVLTSSFNKFFADIYKTHGD